MPSKQTPKPLPRELHELRRLRKLARERWLAGRRAEIQYRLKLLQVARQIDATVRGITPDGTLTVASKQKLIATLNRYGEILTPWAEAVAERMIGDVARRDAMAWQRHGKEIGRLLRREIESAPTGAAMRSSLAEQVRLITSLPREAAERIHELTLEGILEGTRAQEIAAEILRSGEVSTSCARTIARTEVSRTATALTKARAEHIGSPGYIWRTSKDGAVRPSHRAMEGRLVRWESPPELDNMTGHAGEFPNCRCFPEVIVPTL